MIKVGITGQAGFVGTHLFNTLGLYADIFERVTFEDEYFQNEKKLNEFVSQCDAIVHLAAMNRHNDSEVIFKTNVKLVTQLIGACESTNSKPYILFSSSTQEERDNLYGESKKIGRELFEKWAHKNSTQFSGLIIPNIFGPFGNPYYNSVVATFCHQLTHNETPKIEVDAEIKLIFVSELVYYIIDIIHLHSITKSQNSEIQFSLIENNEQHREIKETLDVSVNNTTQYVETINIPHTSTIKVSVLLVKLMRMTENYFKNGTLPNLNDSFERNLFNTFLCYIDYSTFFPFYLKKNTDNRGSFTEIVKLNSGGQLSFSTSISGITRGNHFHTHKVERFAVIKGKARIELRRIGTGKVFSFELDGRQPSFVDMPVWHTHNITNIGKEELYTIFWINKHFVANDPDTYFEKV